MACCGHCYISHGRRAQVGSIFIHNHPAHIVVGLHSNLQRADRQRCQHLLFSKESDESLWQPVGAEHQGNGDGKWFMEAGIRSLNPLEIDPMGGLFLFFRSLLSPGSLSVRSCASGGGPAPLPMQTRGCACVSTAPDAGSRVNACRLPPLFPRAPSKSPPSAVASTR